MKHHAAIILKNNNKILFVQRSATKSTLPNIWAFPSGTIEEGESREETIKREAKEELGIDVENLNFLTDLDLAEFGVKLHFITCETKNADSIVFDLSEIQAIDWLSFDEFFTKFSDKQIGHGLIYLRKKPEIWEAV